MHNFDRWTCDWKVRIGLSNAKPVATCRIRLNFATYHIRFLIL